jgi:hypothetical protein
VLRDLAAPPPLFARDPVEADDDLRAAPPAGLAALDRALVALDRAAVDRDPAVEDFAREAVLRPLLALRVPLLRDAPPDDEPPEPPLLDPSSALHLPDITRCAASATASAISDPSLVALDIMLLAAWLAVSAASSPASRIARRAFGLALIAAAAAARPAASISLLIAALASLSTVVSLLFEDEPEELLRVDLAIASSPCVARKTLQARNGSRMNSEVRNADMLKGTAGVPAMPFDMVSGRRCGRPSATKAYEHPSPTSVLNHETSDHLLSLR